MKQEQESHYTMNNQSTCAFFFNLPVHLFEFELFQYLTLQDILSLQQTCRFCAKKFQPQLTHFRRVFGPMERTAHFREDEYFYQQNKWYHPNFPLEQINFYLNPKALNMVLQVQIPGIEELIPYLDIKEAAQCSEQAAIAMLKCDRYLLQKHVLLYQVLEMACSDGYLEILSFLLEEKGCNPSDRENSALSYACEMGHPNIVQRLLEDPRINPATNENLALLFAVIYGHIEVMHILLNDPRCDPTDRDNGIVEFALAHNYDQTAEILLNDPRVNQSNFHLQNFHLRRACASGKKHLVKASLENPEVDPGADDNLAIITAASEGHVDIVEILLQDDRVDPSARDNIAIIEAASKGHLGVVKRLLLEPSVDPSARFNAAVIEAARNGHTDVVKALLGGLHRNRYMRSHRQTI